MWWAGDDAGDLAVRDVADLLRTQYAIITGGKTENGCPIITFPDIGNFSALGDLEYQTLMLYLTSVPSMQEADVGFVLVIDRRNDRWNSVKPALLKLSGYFPGLVQAVYVLRPSGLIKKTISDVLNKLFKEDFKFKVTVCNSLEELHGYIDKSQLTPELGGTLQYHHVEWIRQREELEKFSAEMKEVSGKLDCFTKKMQDTEIPGDAETVQELLTLQQKEYGELKEEILNAAKHGESLLEMFRKSQVTDEENREPQTDKLGNVAAVERLLVQLEETERTFCEFQSDHFQRLKLWLDRRIFERDVTELESKFDQHLKTVNEMIEVGENANRVDNLIREANSFQKLCLTDIDRAEEVISNGQRLLKTKQYSSEETLQPDCDRLKKLCIILTERIDHRLDTLKKHRELQEQIDKANAWCATGIELLSSQHIEKAPGDSDLLQKSILEINDFLSTAESLQLNCPKKLFKDNITPETKALVTQVVHRIADVTSMCDKRLASLQLLTKNRHRPVQAVTPEPGVPLQPSHGAPVLNKPKILKKANTVAKLEDPWNQLKSNQNIDKDIPSGDPQVLKSKRQHILAELLETEQVYVNELHSILKGYKEEMESPEMKPLLPAELVGKADVLFGNLDEIYSFHDDLFLKDLQNCISTTELVALCFTHRKNEFYKLYSTYCQNSPKSEQLRQVVGERNFFFGACQIKLGHKLPLAAYLLKPIQRITKYQLLLKDLLRSSEAPKCRSQLQEALKCMLVVLKCVNDSMHQIAITGFRGDLADQGELLMQGSFSVWTESKKIRELRLTPMHRHIFLYRKAILFCKKENKENNKATYHFKRYLQMSQIGLTESVKGDPKKFEIWLQGRQQVHTIQASTVEQKLAWVQQIKEVLLEQLAELRGANMRQYSLNKTPILHRTLRQTTSWESQSSMDSSTGSNNRAFSCDETNSPHIQPLIESEEESSDQSNSEDEDTFSEQVPGAKYVVLADYRSQGHNEISLQEGTLVEILKVGCGGWWYIKLLDHYFQGQPIEGCAWVTLATNDSYSLGALVLAHSLKKSNTAHKLAVLITPAVSQPMREQLQTVFDVVKTVDVLDSKDEAHLALMKRPELGITFTKIHCWRLVEFEKCVFLDADTLVVRNCDELFQREEFSAAPDVSWPDCFNSGVFVYKPSAETFNKLLQFAVEKGSFDGGDQGLLNQFFSDWATEDIKKHLPFVYNLTSVAVYSYIPAFKHYGAETRIVHFIGAGKPWLQQLDPATRTITPTSGSEHLAPLLQQWWDLFCEKVHPNLSKNLENNNDGMSHPPVEVRSNTPVALTSDEPQSPCLIEPCLQYREKDDYRQHNLPYQPFAVRGSSDELLNIEYLLISVVPSDELREQQRGDEVEEKDTGPEEQQEVKQIEQKQPEIVHDKAEEKEPPSPKDPFDYNTFFPDEKCVSNYLEQNVVTYQPFEIRHDDKEPENVSLPRFLTMPEDDQRQKGNIENVEYQPAPEPPPPPPQTPAPISQTLPVPPTTIEKPVDVPKQLQSPPVEKHELSKSKSMTFIPNDDIAKTPSPPKPSIWTSLPNVNVDSNRKYSMPKLKPILPRQNSRLTQAPIPRVTLYTEILMSADYKDPDNLPKDKVGFIEKELRRSKSEVDLRVKFGPLLHTKSPDVEIPEPKKSPIHNLRHDAYDLSRCKRQQGNKPRDHEKENIPSKLITPWKDKKTVIKKRKSKELSPNDGAKEKPLKKERKERQKKSENVEEILKRLWEFSKNYQHYFGVNTQKESKEPVMQSEFKQFRNFVKDQKETTQKGLLGIKDIMKETVGSEKKCVKEMEIAKVDGPDKHKAGEVVIENRDKIQANTNTSAEHTGTIAYATDQHENNKNKSVEVKLTNTKNKLSNTLEIIEVIPNAQNKPSEDEKTHEHSKTSANGYTMTTSNDNNQNEDASITQLSTQSILSEKTKKNSDLTPEKLSNGYANLSKASKTSSTEPVIPEKTAENRKLMTVITKVPEDDLQLRNITKQPEDNLYTSSSQTERKSSKVMNETTTRRINGENYKELEYTTNQDETKTDTTEEVKQVTEVVTSRSGDKGDQETEVLRKLSVATRSNILESIAHSAQTEEDKNDEVSTALDLNNVQQDVKGTMPSENQISEVDSKQSETQEPSAAEVLNKVCSGVDTVCESEATVVRKIVHDLPELQAPAEAIPKGIFTIGSPKENIQVNVKDGSHSDKGIASTVSLKSIEEVPPTTKATGRFPKPDEILCVPDFDTPRTSRILAPISKPDTDATPQAPPSSPVATPRKARIQRKPYENGSKYRSPSGKKTPSGKHSAGIAGAIAQLNLEGNGQEVSSDAKSAAHQEYIRRQNWETGNMDYMGKDSFDNIWSKICQTLEGKELDKAGESTPTTISIEEKTTPEGGAGTEVPVSLTAILQKFPEFIDTLPSETVTAPVEEDEIIFSKPENRQKCLTNIKEEEENISNAEGESVRLSDILKPDLERPAPAGIIVPKESAINAGEEVKPDEKPQPLCSSTVSTTQTIITPPITEGKPGPKGDIGVKELPITALEQAKPDGNPQLSYTSTSLIADVQTATSTATDLAKTETPILEILTLQSEKPIQPQIAIQPPTPECTTVAIRQPICIPGVPSEDQTPKTPGQKMTEKKHQQQQQQSDSPTEPIPLPAPESRNDCKTIAIAYPPIAPAQIDEKEETMKTAKEEKQKKGVFSKILEMVGVVPKSEEASKSVFYDVGKELPETENGVEVTEQKTAVQEANKTTDAEIAPTAAQIVDEAKEQTLEKLEKKVSDTITKITEEIGAENKQDAEGSAEAAKQDTDRKHAKAGQAPMPKPARNSSPKSFAPKAPSSVIIPQTSPETTPINTTPEPPKRRNSALLKVDETIPATPPVPAPEKEIVEPVKTEVENIIEKAKTEVESLLQDRRSAEKEANETTNLINTMRLMIGAEAPQPEEVEELKVTTEEERQRHKGEVASSKLSDQILKAIPPPRRKAISESKSEASGSSGAIPKTPKQKPSSIPVPPPRSKGKPTPPPPSKGKTKK